MKLIAVVTTPAIEADIQRQIRAAGRKRKRLVKAHDNGLHKRHPAITCPGCK